jgi:RNA polymerase sigma-70 factor (ECF subfamily)
MWAEDALVMAFTRVFEKIGQFKGDGSLEAWIKTIIIRDSLDILRKNNALRFEDLELTKASDTCTYEGDPLEKEDLMKAIQDLPVGFRTVFNLFVIEGYSHKEIAAQLGISENTSKSQLSRARTHLQQLLVKYNRIETPKRI